MTDVARIGFAADTTDLVAAQKQLEKLSVEAGKAEVAARKLEKAQTSASLAAARVASIETSATAAIARGSKTMSAAEKQAAADSDRMATASLKAAQAADAQATASLRAAQAAVQQAEAAQKIVSANQSAADSAQNLATANAKASQSLRVMGQTAGQQQANMTNIAAQFQDIGVTAAMGMNPMMIGLQQGAQLTGVWGSIAGTTAQKMKTFGASIMAVLSPMSLVIIALTAGVAWLIQWGMESLNASKDTKTLGDATSALSGLQSQLGDMFDMTSGKIKNNSELIRVNTLMTILNAQAKAKALALESGDILGEAAKGKKPNLGLFASGFGFIISGPEQIQQGKNLKALQQFSKDYATGVTKAEDAILAAGKLDLRGTGFTVDQLREAVQGSVTAKALENMASDAMKSYQSGSLVPSLRTPGTPHAAPKGPKPEPTQAEKFSEMMKQADEQIAKYEGESQAVALTGFARKEYINTIELEAEAKRQNIDLTVNERQKTLELKAAKMAAAEQSKENEEAYRTESERLREQSVSLQDELNMRGKTSYAIAMQRYERKLLNDEMFRGITYSPAQKKALLDEYSGILQTTEALEKHARAVEFDRDATRGFLGDLKSGLTQGKSLWESWGNAVLNVLNKIIDKLLDDVVNEMFQASGGGGILGGIGKLLGVASSAAGASAAAIPSGYTSMVNTGTLKAAKGGVFTNSIVNQPTQFYAKGGTPGVMGEAGPEAIMPLQRGPDGSLGVQMYGGTGNSQSAPSVVQIVPSAYFDVVVDDRAAKVAAPMVVQGSMAATKVSESNSVRSARRRIV